MGKLFKMLTLMLIMFAGASMAMAQSAVKVAPDVAKQNQITQDAEEHLMNKMDAYRSKQGYGQVPGFVPTGDPTVDDAAYHDAKKMWLMNLPDGRYTISSSGTWARPAGANESSANPVAAPH